MPKRDRNMRPYGRGMIRSTSLMAGALPSRAREGVDSFTALQTVPQGVPYGYSAGLSPTMSEATQDQWIGSFLKSEGYMPQRRGFHMDGRTGDCRFSDIEVKSVEAKGRIMGFKGEDVPSANDLTLGDGNLFDVTGAVQVNGIKTLNWTDGSVVTFKFDGTPTLKHDTAPSSGFLPLWLAGSIDFTPTAGSTLTLVLDSTHWIEVARSVS